MISFHVFSDRMNVTCQFVSRIGSKRPRPSGVGGSLQWGSVRVFHRCHEDCRIYEGDDSFMQGTCTKGTCIMKGTLWNLYL